MRLTKRSLMMVASIALCAVMTIGGTLAYLTDTASQVNTFTMGAVDIELGENYEDESTLMPGVIVDKEAWVENVGSSDAWVFMSVAVPTAALENGEHTDFLNHEINGDSDWAKMERTPVTIEGAQYMLYVYQYGKQLASGEKTASCLTGIGLHPQVDFDPNSGEYKLIAGGQVAATLGADITTGKVYVNAYAIQTEGFEDAKAAYAAYVEQWGPIGETQITLPNADNATPDNWVELLKTGKSVKLASGEYTLNEDLKVSGQVIIPGGSKVTLNLNNTLDNDGTAHTIVVENTGNLTVKGGTVQNEAKAGVVNKGGKVTMENVKITNVSNADYAVVTHAGTTTLNNCDVDSSRGGVGVTGELIVNGGSVTARDYYPVYLIGNGKATFNGTEIVRANQKNARYMVYAESAATGEFTTCTFESERPASNEKTKLANNYANLTFNNCTYTNLDTTGLN